MNKSIIWKENDNLKDKKEIEKEKFYGLYIDDEAINYHKSFSEYSETSLHILKNYSKKVGIKNVFIKDESTRFGLNAFKVLGASFAIGKYIGKMINKDMSEITFEYLESGEWKKELKDITLVSTTDGNHGRGVAWTAKQLEVPCRIYMPKGSTENRLKNITDLGAYGEITEYNYDETVRLVNELAEKNGWTIIQDTAWEGYEDIPKWIMKGYSTLAKEVIKELKENIPTHIFLQAGVGAFAGVMASVFTEEYIKNPPKIILVEPSNAACFFESALNNKCTAVGGDLNTIMCGLACGEPNPLGYEILSRYCDVFLSVSDEMTKRGMKMLNKPLKDDPKITSGESGAVGMGVLDEIMTNPEYDKLKTYLELNEKSNVLIISTEGNTDPDVYKSIIEE